jgi:hypothetical protein
VGYFSAVVKRRGRAAFVESGFELGELAGEAKRSRGLVDAVASGAGEDSLDFDIAICDLKINS